ncbi:hypothetical protein MDAP_002569 [Mitosporidium daphniae]
MTVTKSEKDWNEALELFHEKKSESLDDLVPVCEYNGEFIDFPEHSERKLAFIVVNNLVMITHNTTKVHTFVKRCICETISYDFYMRLYRLLQYIYVRFYAEKYQNGGVHLPFDPTSIVEKTLEVVFEVAFIHKQFEMLFYKSHYFFTSYILKIVDCIGIYIHLSMISF